MMEINSLLNHLDGSQKESVNEADNAWVGI